MKHLLILLGILLFAIACSTQKGVVQLKSNEREEMVEDSLEYELETFDGKFESWYIMQKSPAQYRSQQYYESWNQQYVSAWNSKTMSSKNYSFFEPIIGYEPGVDYGFELNHELFYYFQYVENILKVKIMSGSPRVMLR